MEEKEAINILKEFIKKQQEQIISSCFGINKKTLGTITEKQTYAIEILILALEDLKLKYEQNLKFVKHYRKELEKKDKIIDLMLGHIDPFRLPIEEKTTESAKQYFEKKAEEDRDVKNR